MGEGSFRRTECYSLPVLQAAERCLPVAPGVS